MKIFCYTSKYQYIDLSKIDFLNNYNFIFFVLSMTYLIFLYIYLFFTTFVF